MLEADRRRALDPMTEALRMAAQSDRFLGMAAWAEEDGHPEAARDFYIQAEAWECQAWVLLE